MACLCAMGLLCQPASAASMSDLLIVLDADGRAYTAQQTLSTETDLVVLQLPPKRKVLRTVFSGPERLTFAQAHQQNPEQISLWSGSVLTRYKHRYGQGLVKPDATRFSLNTSTEHLAASTDDFSTLQSSVTWVLPSNATVEKFEASWPDAKETDNQTLADTTIELAENWTINGNTLNYSQSSGSLPALNVVFRLEPDMGEKSLPCDARMPDSDLCSPDVDGDEIADYRDVCLPAPDLSGSNSPPVYSEVDLTAENDGTESVDPIGCQNQSVVVLQGVRFQSGQSYLDVAARTVLDRVALALQSVPEQLFQIASHTDNTGRVAHNQRLSENRADAIRHYLMLRGVSPNQLQARGYGENSPRHDNSQPQGRRANRRVELRRLE